MDTQYKRILDEEYKTILEWKIKTELDDKEIDIITLRQDEDLIVLTQEELKKVCEEILTEIKKMR